MGVVSGERFFKRNEDSCNFGSHGEIKFEIKTSFIHVKDNPKDALWCPCFDTTNIPKYKWEVCLQMEKSVDKWRIFLPRYQ